MRYIVQRIPSDDEPVYYIKNESGVTDLVSGTTLNVMLVDIGLDSKTREKVKQNLNQFEILLLDADRKKVFKLEKREKTRILELEEIEKEDDELHGYEQSLQKLYEDFVEECEK